MKHRVLILTGDNSEAKNAWKKIGTVVTEIAELYQAAKEAKIDLVLIDERYHELKHPVAAKIRRFNGLTEIWRITSPNQEIMPHDESYDGSIDWSVSEEALKAKIVQIMQGKELLEEYSIIGRSAKMKLVAETINRIAPTDVPILIVGPSGAGKELVARAIHDNSTRSKKSFVALNCGAIAEGLLESELFGHEKGAFTGSVSKREGLFHKANGGTIFLDEIGETKAEMQVKLLRVLEDGTYYPVGSSEIQRADVRILAATNRDLNEAIADKLFREDLYFRIGVVKIILPPLYERKADIEPLLQFFWREHQLEYSDSALELLLKYDWPGNVRQLKNFADRMTAFKAKGLVDSEDVERFIEEQHGYVHNLPVSTGKTSEQAGQELIYHAILSLGNEIRMLRDLITAHLPTDAFDEDSEASAEAAFKGMTVDDMEKLMMRHVLAETNGNRKEAAKKLGIGERTLYRKLKKYNLS